MIPLLPTSRALGLALLLLAGVLPGRAEVQLHNLFTDHMVLQRGVPVRVWGWADEGEKVTVEFRKRKVTTQAKGGAWMVVLPKLEAGGPDELKVVGKNTLLVRDVLVGEVWVASGQSNMEWPLRLAFEPKADIEGAASPNLRLFTVPKLKNTVPAKNVEASWQECGPLTVSNFSAVAYYFGRYLQKALGVPVGIIHTSWGGSPAEVWIREEILAANPGYRRDILDAFQVQQKKTDEAIADFEKEQAEAKQAGKPFNKPRPFPGWRPSELYNGMIAPLLPYAIKGAIWYQGESNAERAYQYRTLFADLIRNWRKDWGLGDFPFLAVQLAPFKAIQEQPKDSSWAELREAQELATRTLPRVGLAVITDVGDEKDIHPRWKKPVGYRLALEARRIAYDEPILSSGPRYRSMKVRGGQAILSFDSVGDGLSARPLPPRGQEQKDEFVPITYDVNKGVVETALAGFAIAGEDRRFVWAKAEIRGDKIIVANPVVSKPAAVRFGWADYPVVNLYGLPGGDLPPLPASPFRTDDWPMLTGPKPPAKH